MSQSLKKQPSKPERILAFTIFGSRWIQAPLYIGLIVAQVFYVALFMKELGHLLHVGLSLKESDIMLAVLGLIDIVMISNLLIMVIIGGYETFVTRMHMEEHPDHPEWLDEVNASTMKIKLAMALIGISSIHLLKTFINVQNLSEHAILWQVVIHSIFVLSALALAHIAVTMDASHSKEASHS